MSIDRISDELSAIAKDIQAARQRFEDTIVMSPNGDSVLVDGQETYIQDVASQLELLTNIPVPKDFASRLEDELEGQFESGYVELGVRYRKRTGWQIHQRGWR